MKSDSNKKLIKLKRLEVRNTSLKSVKDKDGNDKWSYIFGTNYSKYKTSKSYSYKINDLLLHIFEINLNIKFLILDENMKLNSFNVFNSYTFNDYLDVLPKLEDNQKEEEKVVNRKNYLFEPV